MSTLKKWLYLRVINYITKDLLHLVETKDMLKVHNDNLWTINGKELDKNSIKALQNDVEVFGKSTLWKLIRKEGKRQANQNMFVHGKSEMDLLAGKMLLYYIQMIDDLMTKMKRKKK